MRIATFILILLTSCNLYQTPKYKLGRRVVKQEMDSITTIENGMRLGEYEYQIKFEYFKIRKQFFNRKIKKVKAKGYTVRNVYRLKGEPTIDTISFIWVSKIYRIEDKIVNSKVLYSPINKLIRSNLKGIKFNKSFIIKAKVKKVESLLFNGTGLATIELVFEE